MKARPLLPGQPVTAQGQPGSRELLEVIQRLVGAVRSRVLRLTFHAHATDGLTLTDQAAAEQFLGNTSRSIQIADLSGFSQVRLSARVRIASASANGPKIYVKYRSSYSGTEANYSDIGASEVGISLATAGLPDSGWIDLVPGAQIDPAYVAVMQSGGDGAADPALAGVVVEFR